MKNKLVLYSITILIAIIMTIGLLSVVIINGNGRNVIINGYNAGINEVSAVNEVINPNYDSLINGNSWELNGTTRTLKEAQWNGRIETKLHLGGISYIYINVDPRNVAWNDDIIIEYRSFYKNSNGSEVNQKLHNFYAHITFYTEKGAVISQTCNKDMDSQAGFTKRSGKGSVYHITVDVKVTSLSGVTREARFVFA